MINYLLGPDNIWRQLPSPLHDVQQLEEDTSVNKGQQLWTHLGPNTAVNFLPTTQLDGTGESPLVGGIEDTMNYQSYYDDAIDK